MLYVRGAQIAFTEGRLHQHKTIEHMYTHTDLQRVPSEGAGEAERVALSQNARRRNNSHCGCNCGERERMRGGGRR